MKFNPTRLSVARQRRLLNKKGFADLVGVSAHTVTRWESGMTLPSDQTVQDFSNVLKFPVGFFFGSNLEVPESGLVSFRSQKAMTAGIRDAALAAGAIGFLISDWVEKQFDLPDVDLRDLSLYEPEAAAVALRQEWGLGEQPIKNMVHLLESKGVRVLSLAENSKRVNAFSLWRDDKPYVFLNTMKTAENSRFDTAHELGHLVLHQDGMTTGRKAEDEANQFASAFLMPKADLLAQGVRNVYSLGQLIELKKRWKVSVAALNYRIHKLGFTSPWKYRDFCIQLSTLYRNSEPDGIEREKSVVWQKVMTFLWSEKVTQFDIAKDLDLPESEVNALIFGILYDGSRSRPQTRQALSLVKSDASG
ncbi:MAG: XRE family transcriptional regulator [Alphaproteobacteria bacterium HGW-Alphaproteobacteria-11]|nr:MAG: XRE family transcriptional regulator [Alphaproteobacteria bacterium HGW-Alphaproteobacteria-11]